jgi:putative serine protease PepD
MPENPNEPHDSTADPEAEKPEVAAADVAPAAASPEIPVTPADPSEPAAPSVAPGPADPSVPGAPPAPPAAPDSPQKRSAGIGMIAAVAIAALVGGASGAGIYAIASSQAPRALENSGSVASNLMVNDVDNATVITGVAATVAPSVVTLSVNDGSSSGTGSGVVLTEDGYVLTNAHVATLSGQASDPTIKIQSFDGRLFDATLVGSDPVADLAVVKIDSDVTFQPAEFGDSSELNVGDTAIAIGAPLGLANTVTSGVVSALNRSITVASSAAPDTEEAPAPDDNGGSGPFDFWEFDNGQGDSGNREVSSTIALAVIQTDAAINPGNSGGALLDEDGKVIGINVAIASTGSASTAGSIGVGFAIPANLAKRVAFELIEDGTASHGLLGATVADVEDDTSIADSSSVGAAIQAVTPDGPAEKAGLKKGDVVTEINGLPITGKTDITAQVRVLAGGSDAQITYVRDGRSYTADVVLGEL